MSLVVKWTKIGPDLGRDADAVVGDGHGTDSPDRRVAMHLAGAIGALGSPRWRW
jgi:hypothetical protein